MTSAFTQQNVSNLAYSHMIGVNSPFSANPGADGLMGGLMSGMGAMGGPMLMGAMGMMGIDPLSMGLKAGMGAFSGGASLAGATAAGLGTAAAVGIPLAAGGFMMNQMFHGANQQSQLNNALRANFRHMGPSGQGFNRGDMAGIGHMMRGMTHEFGPGGEITGMNELTQIAAQMGQMSMRAVRSVQDFNQKFKQTVENLKTMARDLGTTLEGAMQFAQSAQSSGIFRQSDQLRFTGMARNMSMAGGVALNEVTGMANIGSQIARSVGGLGRQGAFGGMRAIGNIGTAIQVGALTEEDIYNSTGLRGAEGRQAMATNMLANDARFLQSGRGRRLLAAMADKNGNLNESAVTEFMSGGFDVSRTIQLDHERLGAVGRANFIRNEGRLRGSILERFGGNVNAMALMGWASGKGIDINEMDDRSMLFAQRQLGMGRDEFESALSMAKRLPDILREQRDKAQDDTFLRKLGDENRMKGVEGLKTKFKQARESLQGHLQQAGQEFFNEGSDMIEKFVNQITGQFVQSMSRDADAAFRSGGFGGSYGKAQFDRVFGTKGPFNMQFQGATGGGLKNFESGFFGTSARDRFEASGYSFAGVDAARSARGDVNGAFDRRMKEVMSIQGALGQRADSNIAALGAQSASMIRGVFAYGGDARGDALMEKFGSQLMAAANSGDPTARALYSRWQQAGTPAARAAIMNSAAQGAGVSSDMIQGMMGVPGFGGGTGGLFRSEMSRDEYLGSMFLGRGLERNGLGKSLLAGTATGAAVGAGVGALFGGIGAAPGAALGAAAGFLGGAINYAFGTSGDQRMGRSLGRTLFSDEFRDLAKDMFTGGADAQAGAVTALENRLMKIKAGAIGRELTAEERGEMQALNGLKATQELTELRAKNGGDVSDEMYAKIAQKYGIDIPEGKSAKDHMLGIQGAVFAGPSMKIKETRDVYGRKLQAVGQQELANMKSLGIAAINDKGQLSISAGAVKGMNAQQTRAMQLLVRRSQGMASATGDNLEQQQLYAQEFSDSLTGMSVAEKRAFAERLSQMGLGSQAGEVLDRAGLQEKFGKAAARKGAGVALGEQFGIKTKADITSAAGQKQFLSELEQQLGGNLKDKGAALSDIEKIASGVKGGKDVSALIRGLQGGQIGELMKDKRARDQEAENPLLADIKKGILDTNKHLETIAKDGGTSRSYLNQLVSQGTKDTEKKSS